MDLTKEYEVFKGELLSAVLANEIDENGEIWIVRSKVPFIDDYYPIIDWYGIDDFKHGLAESEEVKMRAVRLSLKRVWEELETWSNVEWE